MREMADTATALIEELRTSDLELIPRAGSRAPRATPGYRPRTGSTACSPGASCR